MTRHISKGEARMGDLVFWGAGGSDHVGIYAGGNRYFSAQSPAQGIHMNTLDSVVGKGRPLFGRIKGMPSQKAKPKHQQKADSRLVALVKRELGSHALKWIKDNRPEEYGKIGAVLSNKDFVGFLLTGVVKQEIGDASGNNFLNLATQQYDAKLFDFFDIPEMFDKMPELIKATDLRGTITQAAAAQTNLQEGTPVFGGMFDIDACSIATGVLDDSKFSVIAGTWNMNIFPSDKTAPQESGLMNSIFPTGKNLIEAPVRLRPGTWRSY